MSFLVGSIDTYTNGKTLNGIVSWLEKMWLLGLVSFLPIKAQENIREQRHKIAKLLGGKGEEVMGQARRYVEFHEPQAFHCTQLLLKLDRGGSRV